MYKTGAEDGEMSEEEKLCCQNNKRKEDQENQGCCSQVFAKKNEDHDKEG